MDSIGPRTTAPGPRWGFTILEMMVVVALVGICAAMATTSYRKVMRRSQARSSVEDLLVSLHRMRSDATTRQRHSGFAFAEDTALVFPDGAGGTRKGLRYATFVDAEASGIAGAWDPGDSLITPWKSMPGEVFSYSTSSSGLSGGVASIVFRTDGTTDNDLSIKLGIAGFPDTFRINLLPATGLATLDD